MYSYKITYKLQKYLNEYYKRYILRIYKNGDLIKYYESFTPLIIRDILDKFGLDEDNIFIDVQEEKR